MYRHRLWLLRLGCTPLVLLLFLRWLLLLILMLWLLYLLHLDSILILILLFSLRVDSCHRNWGWLVFLLFMERLISLSLDCLRLFPIEWIVCRWGSRSWRPLSLRHRRSLLRKWCASCRHCWTSVGSKRVLLILLLLVILLNLRWRIDYESTILSLLEWVILSWNITHSEASIVWWLLLIIAVIFFSIILIKVHILI